MNGIGTLWIWFLFTLHTGHTPNPWIAQTRLSIGMDVSDSGSGIKSVQCDKQGDGQFEACGSEMIYNSLVENQNYLLVMKGQDKAGNFSRPKQINWRSDQTAPTLTLSSGLSNKHSVYIKSTILPCFQYKNRMIRYKTRGYENRVIFEKRTLLSINLISQYFWNFHCRSCVNRRLISSVLVL